MRKVKIKMLDKLSKYYMFLFPVSYRLRSCMCSLETQHLQSHLALLLRNLMKHLSDKRGYSSMIFTQNSTDPRWNVWQKIYKQGQTVQHDCSSALIQLQGDENLVNLITWASCLDYTYISLQGWWPLGAQSSVFFMVYVYINMHT